MKKDIFIKWIIKRFKRKIYEYEHHEYFTLDDMKEAFEFGLILGKRNKV